MKEKESKWTSKHQLSSNSRNINNFTFCAI